MRLASDRQGPLEPLARGELPAGVVRLLASAARRAQTLPQQLNGRQGGGDQQPESRLAVVAGDVYTRLLADPTDDAFDAILIDVDHSPDERLDPSSAAFYSPAGLCRAARHLRAGGVIALWSYEEHAATMDAMRQALNDVSAHPVSYYNRHVQRDFTDWILTGRVRGARQAERHGG